MNNQNKTIGIKLHKDRDEILNFCKKFPKIHLYGTGVVAGFIYEYFKEEKITFSDVIVSDGQKKKDTFKNLKVYEISDLNFSKEEGFILGVRGEIQKDIISYLVSKGIPENNIYAQRIFIEHPNPQYMVESLLNHNLDINENTKSVYFKDNTLNEIGERSGTDKSSGHHNYLNKYEFFLKKWENKEFSLLELGVFKGASIKMWSQYFKNATVYGVDIDENCRKYEEGNCKIIIKDLGNEDDLKSLIELHPSIIIDDASHMWSHQIKSLYHLISALENGGVFIMEDIGTSFSSYRNMNYDDAIVSAYDFCSAIAEVVCSREFLRISTLSANMLPLKKEIELLAEQIEMISFIHESCIILKR